MVQSTYFPHMQMLEIAIIIISNLHMFQYFVLKPGAMEESGHNEQLRTKQKVLRLNPLLLLDLG